MRLRDYPVFCERCGCGRNWHVTRVGPAMDDLRFGGCRYPRCECKGYEPLLKLEEWRKEHGVIRQSFESRSAAIKAWLAQNTPKE